MAILEVVKFPDLVLKKVCSEVILFDESLERLLGDLIETMQSYKYCIGLAAPQTRILQRIIVMDVTRARKPQSGNGLLILINPVILELSNFKIVREGCLSIPDFTANVKRGMYLKVQFQDKKGLTKTLETQDLEAHAIQHEIDHLDGILFLDRIINPATDLFRRMKKD